MSGNKVKYTMRVVRIGEMVESFIENELLIFFGEEVPEELVDLSIIHQHGDLTDPVVPGDSIVIDDHASFEVLAVGDVANHNLVHLGHLIMKANGSSEPELPGDICVERKPLPPIKVGSTITILASQ